MAALDDGAIVVSDGTRMYRVTRSASRRIRLRQTVNSVAPLRHGAFAAVLGSGELVRFGRDGGRRRLARHASPALAAFEGGDRVVTVIEKAPAVVDERGVVKRHPWGSGSEDGHVAPETSWAEPFSMAVASDGALVMALGGGRLRALVPANSPRARLALLTPSELLASGRIGFAGPPNGTVRLEVLRDGSPVADAQASARAGDFRLPAPLPPDLYDVRLNLRDTGAESQARIGLRTTVTLNEAHGVLTSSDGDEFGSAGSRADNCRQLGPALVECLVFDWSSDHDGTGNYQRREVPWGTARVTVDAAGQLRSEGLFDGPPPQGPRIFWPNTQAGAARVRLVLASSLAARATVKLSISQADDGGGFNLQAVTRAVAADQSWALTVLASARQASRVRAWLARGLRVVARVEVTLTTELATGPATTVESRTVDVTR